MTTGSVAGGLAGGGAGAVLGEDDAEDGDEDSEPLEEGEVLAADYFGDKGGGYTHHRKEDAGLAYA